MKKTTWDKIFESNHRSGFGRNRRFQRKCDEPVRRIDLIVIHCSATREDRPFTEQDLKPLTAFAVLMAQAIISTFAVTVISSPPDWSRGRCPRAWAQCKFNWNLL